MCRFITFYCEGEQCSTLNRFIRALVESSQNDPYLHMFSKRYRHEHGWGYAIACFEEDFSTIFFGKSLKPIYNDDLAGKIAEYLEKYEVCLGMIHSRLASKKEPINIYSTQPFHHNLGKHGHLWFIHNGSVDKESLAKILNKEELLKTHSDSYFASLLVAKNIIAKQDLVKAVIGVLVYVRTAFNVGIMILNNNGSKLFTLNYFTPKMKYFKDYYKLYSVSKGNTKIIASSTIIDFYLKEELSNAHAFHNGEAHLWEFKKDTKELVETKILIPSHV